MTLWRKLLGLVELIRLVVLTALTCCVTVFDVDPASFVSPLYAAVIEWEPTDNVDIGHDALPLLKLTDGGQIVVPPSLKVTVPPPPGDRPLTVAVKVTLWPKVLGFVALIRAVELVAWLTT